MPRTNSPKKKMRADKTKNRHNRYQKKSCLTALRKLSKEEKKGADEMAVRQVIGLIDKLTKRHIFHKNKSARLKSKLHKQLGPLFQQKEEKASVLVKK